MAVTVVLAASIGLQVLAAILALRLTRIPGRWRASTLAAVAFFLMALRSSICLYQLVSGQAPRPLDLPSELLGFAGSFLLVVAVVSIASLLAGMRRSGQTLGESETRYRTLVERIPVVTYTAALEGSSTTLYVSPQIEQILGTSPEEYRAEPDFRLQHLHEEDRARVLKELSSSHETGQPFMSEYRMTSADGRPVWIRDEATVVKDDKGNPLYLLGVMSDVTERKRAEEGIRRLATVVLDSNDAVTVQDLEGKVLAWNRGAELMYGWSEEEALDMNILNITPEAEREEALLFVDAVHRGEPVESFETKRVAKDGRVLDVWLTVTKLVDDAGKTTGIATTGRDITERKRAEEELRKLNEELEQRVADRTTALEATNNELEAFAYSVSHDLRAPLRSMDGFSQALLEDYADKLNGQGKDFLQRVRAGSQNMAQLIDDMLKLSRVTRAEMERETVDLSALAREILGTFRKGEPERQVECVVQDGVSAVGDPRLLRMLMENLLENGWKFTGKHPRARIEFGTTEHEDKTTYFVRDDGAGFDPAYVGKLFGAFQRLHSAADFAGTGIGLATVQRIIHRHGGRVWADGEVEKGATFYFTL